MFYDFYGKVLLSFKNNFIKGNVNSKSFPAKKDLNNLLIYRKCPFSTLNRTGHWNKKTRFGFLNKHSKWILSSLILKLKQIIFDNWYIIFLTLTSLECFYFQKPGREKKLHTIQVTYFHFYIHRLIDTKLSFFSKSAVLNSIKNFQYFKKL